MSNKWLNSLKKEESKHNLAADLREVVPTRSNGAGRKPETPENHTAKTAKFANRHKTGAEDPETSEYRAAKTAKSTEAEQLGLVATWSIEFGFTAIHDPTTGEWWDLPTKSAPDWAVREAHKRRELYKDGNRRAYRLTAREMEGIWEEKHTPDEEGIIEEYPVEED